MSDRLYFGASSSRYEGYQSAECCYVMLHLLPSLAVSITSHGRRHSVSAGVTFLDKQGNEIDLTRWREEWSETIRINMANSTNHSVEAPEVGLCITTSTYGRSAVVSHGLSFEGYPSYQDQYEHWLVEPKQGKSPEVKRIKLEE